MDRETLEARLAQLGKQRQLTAQEVERLSRALVMLEGGMAELQWLLAQGEKADEAEAEKGSDAE